MERVRSAGIIHASLEEVWATLNDIAHTPDWVVGLERAALTTPAPFGKGSVYIDYNRLGPFLQATPWRVTEFVPLVCQVHVSESRVIPSTLTMGVSMATEGTRLEMTMEVEFLPQLGALGRLLERHLMKRAVHHVITNNLVNLDRLLTARRARVATGVYAAAQA